MSEKIASGAVTTKELAAGAVEAENISAEGISADLITAGSLSATRVELDGNDLSTQMQFILSEMDRKQNSVWNQVDRLNRIVLEDKVTPAFNALYGDLKIPNNAYAPFAKWLNTSHNRLGADGLPALIDLRSQRDETLKVWTLKFSQLFEGRIQTYVGGKFVAEYVQDPSTHSYPSIRLDNIDQVIWYAESHATYVYAWTQGYNVGGAQPRYPSNEYSYTDPHVVDVFTVYNDVQILDNIRGAVSMSTPIYRTRGTQGGKTFVKFHRTDRSVSEVVYPTDISQKSEWFPPVLGVKLEAPASKITIEGTMHIGQPRRSDRYGFAVFKNDTLIDFVVDGGVGSLSGGSALFSHEDIHLYKTITTPLYTEDRFRLIPIILRNIPGPSVNAFIMHWEVIVTTSR